MQDLATFLTETLIVVLAAVITKYLIPSIKISIDRNLAAIKNDKVEATLKRVSAILFDITAETTQTFVEKMKKEGTWNEETKKQAFEETKQKALLMISVESQLLINEIYQDFDVWLKTQIESSVFMLKE